MTHSLRPFLSLAALAASVLVVCTAASALGASRAVTAVVAVSLVVLATVVEFRSGRRSSAVGVVERLLRYEGGYLGSDSSGGLPGYWASMPEVHLVVLRFDGGERLRVHETDHATYARLHEGDRVEVIVAYGGLTGIMRVTRIVGAAASARRSFAAS